MANASLRTPADWVIKNGRDQFTIWLKSGVKAKEDAAKAAIEEILDDAVVLFDYDDSTVSRGKAAVMQHLDDIRLKTKDVTFSELRARDGEVAGIDYLQWKAKDQPSHECCDLFQVNDQGLVTEIHICFVKDMDVTGHK